MDFLNLFYNYIYNPSYSLQPSRIFSVIKNNQLHTLFLFDSINIVVSCVQVIEMSAFLDFVFGYRLYSKHYIYKNMSQKNIMDFVLYIYKFWEKNYKSGQILACNTNSK